MAADISQQPDLGPVRQFSIFVENKVGRLNEMVESLAGADVHIMALCLVDTTDSTIIRIVVDYPERAEQILDEHRFAHDDVPVVAIELQSEAQLKDVTRLLLKAEINIHYVYPTVSSSAPKHRNSPPPYCPVTVSPSWAGMILPDRLRLSEGGTAGMVNC